MGLEVIEVGAKGGGEDGSPSVGQLSPLHTTVRRALEPGDVSGLGEPVDQPGHTTGGEHHLLGELRHRHAVVVGASEPEQGLEGDAAHRVLLAQGLVEGALQSAVGLDEQPERRDAVVVDERIDLVRWGGDLVHAQ